jgi:hypothetical protein
LDKVYLESHGIAPFDTVYTNETETSPSFYQVGEAGMANPVTSAYVDYAERLRDDVVTSSDTVQSAPVGSELHETDARLAEARQNLKDIFGLAA